MSRRTFLQGGPIVGGPLNGTKVMAYGGPVMPAFDGTGRRIGVYVWDEEACLWEFDAYSAGEDTSPSLYEGDGDE